MSIPIIVLLSVLAAILVLLTLVLFSPLWVRVRYEEALSVVAGLAFIRFKVYPVSEKKKKEKSGKTDMRENTGKVPFEHSKEKTKQTEENTAPQKKSSALDTLTLVLDILKSVTRMLGKSAKVDIKKLVCVVSKPDAADTAIQFGLCSGVISTILALCSNFGKCKIDNRNVGASMDFLSGKSRVEADITLSAKTIAILASLIKGYMKNLLRK